MASNPFDQFDAPTAADSVANPFDQFDIPHEAGGFTDNIGPALKHGAAQAVRGLGLGLQADAQNMRRRVEQPFRKAVEAATADEVRLTPEELKALPKELGQLIPSAAVQSEALTKKRAQLATQRVSEARRGRTITPLGVRPMDVALEQTGKEIEQYGTETIKQHPEWERPAELRDRPWTELLADPNTRGAYLARALGESLPNLVGGAAATVGGAVVGGPAGAAAGGALFMHTLEAGYSYDDLRKLAGSDEAAAETANLVGATNALLEAVPVVNLLHKVPGLRQLVTKEAIKEFATKPKLRRAFQAGLQQAAIEGSTEGLQEVVANLGKRVYNKNQDVLEGVGESVFVGALLGLPFGAGPQLVTRTRSPEEIAAGGAGGNPFDAFDEGEPKTGELIPAQRPGLPAPKTPAALPSVVQVPALPAPELSQDRFVAEPAGAVRRMTATEAQAQDAIAAQRAAEEAKKGTVDYMPTGFAPTASESGLTLAPKERTGAGYEGGIDFTPQGPAAPVAPDIGLETPETADQRIASQREQPAAAVAIEPWNDKTVVVRGDQKAITDALVSANVPRGLWSKKASGMLVPKKNEARVRAALGGVGLGDALTLADDGGRNVPVQEQMSAQPDAASTIEEPAPAVMASAGQAASQVAPERRPEAGIETTPQQTQAHPERSLPSQKPVVAFTGDELGGFGQPIKQLILKARIAAKERFAGKHVKNRNDGSDILIPWSGIKKATSAQVGRNAAIAMAKLDEVIANGVHVATEGDAKNRGTIKAVHYYETPISVAGDNALIRVVVREALDGRRYYDHFELQKSESPAPGEPVKDSLQEGSGAQGRQLPTDSESVAPESGQSSSTVEAESSSAKPGNVKPDHLAGAGKKVEAWTKPADISETLPPAAGEQSRPAGSPRSESQRLGNETEAVAILDAAGVTGKDRLDILAKFRAGEYSLEDLKDAYPATSIGKPETVDTSAEPAKKAEENRQVERAAKISDLGEKVGGARKDLASKAGSRGAHPKDEAPGWRKRYESAEVLKSGAPDEIGRWFVYDSRREDWRGRSSQVGDRNGYATKEDAEAAIPLIEVARNHRVRPGEGDSWEIWRAVTDRKSVKVVNQQFPSREDALRYMGRHAQEIIETKTSFGEEILPIPDKVKREGPARREGDVTGDDFMRAYGFRAVEFGNWQNQDERQQVMNHAYDALADLAEVMGIPPRAIGMNGELALAFGARGHGLSGARAHYERDYGVINLTKMKGAGSLGHEWFHALDHYFGRQDTKAKGERVKNKRGDLVFPAGDRSDDYVSHGFSRASQVRPEVQAAYKAIIDTIFSKAERYVEDTQRADQFVAQTRAGVEQALAKIRQGLAAQKDPQVWKRHNKPADAEQLAEFDAIAEKIVAGEMLETQYQAIPSKNRTFGSMRWTNDALEKLSAIHKAVRGRSGFDSTNQNGVLDQLRGTMRRYSQRLKMLAEAQAGDEKTKKTPTSFAMEAKSIDQGRASEYWTTPHEMAARAFQAYVEDKLAERGGRSDFLTYGTNTVVATPWGWKRPFPHGEERKAINTAFDTLIGELKTKETDKGVAMFARTPSWYYSALERAISGAKQPAMPGAMWASWLNANKAKLGVKDAEIEAVGVREYLALHGGKKVGKDELLAFVRENGVRVEEVTLGSKWSVNLTGGNRETFDSIEAAKQRIEEENEWVDNESITVDGDEEGGAIRVVDYNGDQAAWFERDDNNGYWVLKEYSYPLHDDEQESFDDYDQAIDKAEEIAGEYREFFYKEISEEAEPVDRGEGVVKFSDFQLPGGENYRELLLTLPTRQDKDQAEFHSSHFDDPNILAHVRFNTRYVPASPQQENFGKQFLDVASRIPDAEDALHIVNRGVEGMAQHTQIANAVIKLIPVDVVNVLRAQNLAPKELFDNDAVGAALGAMPVKVRNRVLNGVAAATINAEADLRAKVIDTLSAGLDAEVLPALRASDLDSGYVSRLLSSDPVREAALLKRSQPDDAGTLPPASTAGGVGAGSKKLGSADLARLLNAHADIVRSSEKGGKRSNQSKVLFIEELQSDWGQKGKKEGFKTSESPRKATTAIRQDGYWEVRDQNGDFITNVMDYALPDADEAKAIEVANARLQSKHAGEMAQSQRAPSAPFVTDTKSWTALALKRMIRWAAENGFDRVAWTTGEQQADRYDLSKQVDNIKAFRREDDTFDLSARSRDGSGPHDIATRVSADKLADYVGKDLAEKIAAQELGWHTYSGVDLKVGGEGMRGYYDQILPQVARDLLKRLGGKVETIEVSNGLTHVDPDTGDKIGAAVMPQPGFDITPAMREAVMAGQPLFKQSPGAASGLSASEVRTIADRLMSTWKDRPPVRVAATEADLPPAVQKIIEDEGAQGEVAGVFHGGAVYLVAERLPSAKAVQQIVAHEVIGHYGVRKLLGISADRILDQVWLAYGLKGHEDIIRKYFDDTDEKRKFDPSNRAHRRKVAEEKLAHMVETGEKPSILQRLYAAVRDWLRAHGFDLALNDTDIRMMLVRARQIVERGGLETVPEGAVAFAKHDPVQALNDKIAEQEGDESFRNAFRHSDKGDPNVIRAFKAVFGVDVVPIAPASKAGEQFMGAQFNGRLYVNAENGQVGFVQLAGHELLHHIRKERPAIYEWFAGVANDYLESSAESSYRSRLEAAGADLGVTDVREEILADFVGDSLVDPVFLDQLAENNRSKFTMLLQTVRKWLGDVAAKLAKAGFGSSEYIKDVRGLQGYLGAVLDVYRSGGTAADVERPDFDHDSGARFARARIAGNSGRAYTAAQKAAFEATGRTTETPTWKERAESILANAGMKLRQGIADQFAPIADLDPHAYTLSRLSKASDGALEAFMLHGQLKLKDGVYDADMSGGVIDRLLKPLKGEMDDFMWWVASNRAERLAGEGRERLFSPQDIAAYKSLAAGQTDFDYTLQHNHLGHRRGTVTRDRALIYRDAAQTLNALNKNVMDMAEQSGLIDGASRSLWEQEFYIPFYRAMEDGVGGPNIKSGLVRQYAFKQLKGGTAKLNHDLIANTIQNWAHLLSASAKNRAAKATLEAAAKVGAATPIGAAEKGSVYFRENGQEKHFAVDDPFLLDAVTALEWNGFGGPVMKVIGKFKHWLTIGVTANPTFKIRNLIRDSISAVGVSELSPNVAGNLKQGWKATGKQGQTYVSMLASGGIIKFGTMLDSNRAEHVRALVDKGVDAATILDSDQKIKAFWRRYIKPAIDAYNDLGDRGESINRASLYEQLTAKGFSHAEASLMARDILDFSMGGTWTAVRLLTQSVPFMNARLQGLYKLGRSDKKRLGYVIAAVSLASLALLAAYSDDEDWKKREDWDRDVYWWFRFGGIAFRIPKPFEIGAIGTLAERTAELFFDNEMTGERYLERVGHLVGDQLAMNPIPQIVKPVLDVYANVDSFTKRPIETMGMERLRPEDRYTQRSSEIAKALGKANLLSPVQIDHLVRGYFGWLGTATTTAVDYLSRATVIDEPPRPTLKLRDMFIAGNFVETLPANSSRYVSQMYEQAEEIEQAYASFMHFRKLGNKEKAQKILADNPDALKRYKFVSRAKQRVADINRRIRQIEADTEMTAEDKRAKLDELYAQLDTLARRVVAK